jgi:predicted MFS family arabinose efflux permease
LLTYRALFNVPSIGRLLLGMQIARICQTMVSVAIVLFALEAYHSPRIVGLATFWSIFPGLVLSPIAGALLDRHGRTRLVILDYLVALTLLILIGVLALAGALPAWLLMLLAAVASLTAPLSMTGLRSLFPLLIPRKLWERANAVDSAGFVVASIVGPPLVAGIIVVLGAPFAFIFIGLGYGVAAVVIARTPDPPTQSSRVKSVWIEAWEGLVYTWRNPTLRGLGFSISTANLGSGAITILVPLIVLQRLGMSETAVGMVLAVQGIAGMISAVVSGRINSEGRERPMLVLPMIGMGIVLGVLLFKTSLLGLLFILVVFGLLTGPLDIALFTLRQRRTAQEWTGRAFAVSMCFNYLGMPIGAALAGLLASISIEMAVAFTALTSLLAALLAWRLIPQNAAD